ncbi:hypothetical protein V6N11_065952 [Hibiscus sabdariffa]|uniref:Uncharacterized protein n=1 Tax=Hibiscus sabdariffa TaxID=183260 RepID=A0ABR2NUC3_9ROSI
MLLNSRKIFLPAYHLICQEDCALLNGFTVLLITLEAKLVSIPPVKKLAETDFTMQHVITASLDKPQREVLPTDLSHLLSLGQQVIAIHPKTREVNNGKTLRRQNIVVDDFSAIQPPESQVNRHSDFGGPGVYAPSGNLENATSPTNMLANPIK